LIYRIYFGILLKSLIENKNQILLLLEDLRRKSWLRNCPRARHGCKCI